VAGILLLGIDYHHRERIGGGEAAAISDGGDRVELSALGVGMGCRGLVQALVRQAIPIEIPSEAVGRGAAGGLGREVHRGCSRFERYQRREGFAGERHRRALDRDCALCAGDCAIRIFDGQRPGVFALNQIGMGDLKRALWKVAPPARSTAKATSPQV